MSRNQRILLGLMPRRWAAAVERRSREWTIECTGCSKSRSVWDAGGVRFFARGKPRDTVPCNHCGDATGRLYRRRCKAA